MLGYLVFAHFSQTTLFLNLLSCSFFPVLAGTADSDVHTVSTIFFAIELICIDWSSSTNFFNLLFFARLAVIFRSSSLDSLLGMNFFALFTEILSTSFRFSSCVPSSSSSSPSSTLDCIVERLFAAGLFVVFSFGFEITVTKFTLSH